MSDIVGPSSGQAAAESPVDPPVTLPVRAPGKKLRRPLERALVWSLIGVLLLLTYSETWSRYNYQQAFDHLGDRLEEGDEHSPRALDANDVKEFLGDRRPSRTEHYIGTGKFLANGATQLEVYSWFTLNPVHRREMFVYYDTRGPAHKIQPQVLSIQAEEEEALPLLSQKEQEFMERVQKDPRWQRFDTLPGMPRSPRTAGMPASGPPMGLPSTTPAVHADSPADDAGERDGSPDPAIPGPEVDSTKI